MAEEPQVGIEVMEDKPAIRDGKAHFLLTKVWTSVDLAHRGSLAKQGHVAVPDGRLTLEFPVEGENMTLVELRRLMQGLVDSFGGSYAALVDFLEPKDF